MGTKWLSFHTLHSPIQKIDVNTGESNILEDWKRLDPTLIYIDGKTLQTLINENQWPAPANLTLESLEDLLTKHVLKKLPEDKKASALEYLLKSFHQGGLLHPVSAAMYHLFHEHGFGPAATESRKQVNIVTSHSGFSIQEIYTANQFNLSITPPERPRNRIS